MKMEYTEVLKTINKAQQVLEKLQDNLKPTWECVEYPSLGESSFDPEDLAKALEHLEMEIRGDFSDDPESFDFIFEEK